MEAAQPTGPLAPSELEDLNDQQLVRREELQRLREQGIDPYPAAEFQVSHSATEVLEGFSDENAEQWNQVRLAGRIMTRREMGKASFAVLQDASGRIQLYLSRDDLSTTLPDGSTDTSVYKELFLKLTSLGDFVGVEGYVFRTKTGEVTLRVTGYTFLAKTLRPLPVRKEKDGVVYDAFADPELRYRMRYVDLVVNPEVRHTFVQRSKLLRHIRQFLDAKGYLEVETPILQPIYGGAFARPFTTHHNTLDMKLYLRISNELYLKRLVVGGFEGVYEFAKDFRNEGMSRFHNPEFTLMELYVAYKDYLWMMNLVEEMLESAAIALHGSTSFTYGEHRIDFARPWKRITLFDAIKEYAGIAVEGTSTDQVRQLAQSVGVHSDPNAEWARIVDDVFGALVEPKLIQPTFIVDYPEVMSPLAKKHRSKAGLVERFELMCCAKELCNAYSELNDPIDQRQRLEDQLRLRDTDDEAMMLDEDFVRALEFGMPPTAGLGIGIDRLAMVLSNSASIQDVLFFPHMRPEHKA